MTNSIRSIAPPAALGLLVSLFQTGCATTGGAANSLVPTRFETRTGPYVVYTHNPLPADAPTIRQLQSLERQVTATLGVRVEPGEPPIEIYVLSDQNTFDHFLKIYYPELPSRRAFFLAQGQRRVVYTYFNPQLEVDLRHEATHALLHLAFADLPLWIDEGLAEYFEAPDEAQGMNAEHIGKIPADLASGWSPDLARLERIKDVRQMSPRDYREAWAWVHYLLHGSGPGKAALLGYLADLRGGKETSPLSQRLGSAEAQTPASGFVAYLERMRGPDARVEDSAVQPASARPATPSVSAKREPQRTLWERMLDRLRE